MILPVLAAGAVFAAAGALYLFHPRAGPADRQLMPDLKSPLDFWSVAGFALLIGGLNACVALATRWAGEMALLPLAALGGLADVDAIILNVTRMSHPTDMLAASAILLAALTNLVSKSVLAFMAGNLKFGAYFTLSSVAVVLAGVAALAFAWR
jgi:uncharacterized membrane protein (DUF4010 family)